MPRFVIELTGDKPVCMTYKAHAANEEEAREKALKAAQNSYNWDLHQSWDIQNIEVQSITKG